MSELKSATRIMHERFSGYGFYAMHRLLFASNFVLSVSVRFGLTESLSRLSLLDRNKSVTHKGESGPTDHRRYQGSKDPG